MCVVCWQEFDDSMNPPVDLGCGHYGCKSCSDAINTCPVCHAATVKTPNSKIPNSKKCESHQVTVYKPWSTPRRRHLCDELLEDVVDDDHLTATLLGSADEATAPRVRMLERAPSSAAGSVPSRSSSVAVSARHLARGSVVAGRTMLVRALVPAVRVSFFLGKSVLTTTCRAAACTGRLVASAACRFARYAAAPRRSVVGFDGSSHLPTPVPPAPPSTSDTDDPTEAQSTQLSQVGPRRRRRAGGNAAKSGPGAGRGSSSTSPEPISNIVGGRIRLRNCRHTRLRIEYCRDCVVVATGLESVELLMVGCQRVKLVMKNCRGLVLRELQCSSMGDFIRRGCPNFVHEIVCLRCVCKPLTSGGGGSGGGSFGGGH